MQVSFVSRLALLGAAGTALAVLVAAMSRAEVARIEIHPISTVTISDKQFLTGDKNGTSVVIAGELRIPRIGTEKVPVVVLQHGSGGVGGNVDRWVGEFNEVGIATFVVDSFTGRGLQSTVADQALLGRLNMIFDAYRALEVVAKHPRVDPARIALMGFSRGGQSVLYASLKRFQRMHGPAGLEFAAYVAFYPPASRHISKMSSSAINPFAFITALPIITCRSRRVGLMSSACAKLEKT